MKQFEKKKNSAGFYVVAAKILDSLFRKQGTIKGKKRKFKVARKWKVGRNMAHCLVILLKCLLA